jgi:hypothetical protein
VVLIANPREAIDDLLKGLPACHCPARAGRDHL